MTTLTKAQETALELLKANPGNPVVLHVGAGTALVNAGLATKDDTSGHGRLRAAYRLAK